MNTHSITEALQYITDDQSCAYDASPAFAELDQLTNSHAALLGALQEIELLAKEIKRSHAADIILDKARQALALARGEKGGEVK